MSEEESPGPLERNNVLWDFKEGDYDGFRDQERLQEKDTLEMFLEV